MFDVQRCIDWNKNAWNTPWVYKKDLERNMILEEIKETRHAIWEDDVKEVIDWCIDVLYVMCGTMWKLWFSIEEINTIYSFFPDLSLDMLGFQWTLGIESNIYALYDKANKSLDVSKNTLDYYTEMYCLAIDILKLSWLSDSMIIDAWDIVCDSNDTKLPFTKDKAGKVRKSKNFVEPNFDHIIDQI